MTVRELFSAINERYKHEAEKDKADWERARVITFMVLDTSQARQADKRKVKKQFVFPWDKPDGAIGESSLTKQDMERIKESMKKLDK